MTQAEKIQLALKAMLATVGSVAGVVRPVRNPQTAPLPPDHSIELFSGDCKVDQENCAVGNPPLIAWNWTQYLNLIVLTAANSTTPFDCTLNEFAAEVIAKLLSDRTISGTAHYLDIVGQSPAHAPDGSYVGLVIEIVIQYRHPENDFTTLA